MSSGATGSFAFAALPDFIVSEKLDAAAAKLRSVNAGRNDEIFVAGVELGPLGLSANEIAAAPNLAVGTEPHMLKKISGVIKSLNRHGRR